MRNWAKGESFLLRVPVWENKTSRVGKRVTAPQRKILKGLGHKRKERKKIVGGPPTSELKKARMPAGPRWAIESKGGPQRLVRFSKKSQSGEGRRGFGKKRIGGGKKNKEKTNKRNHKETNQT